MCAVQRQLQLTDNRAALNREFTIQYVYTACCVLASESRDE